MDPLSATASCMSILQILGTAGSVCRTSQRALKDIESIKSEVESLKDILQSLGGGRCASVIPGRTLIKCERSLEKLRKKLEKINRSSDRRKRWEWIFVKEEVTEHLDSIRGARQNLVLDMISLQSTFLDRLQNEMQISNTSHHQHYLESSERDREILSLMKSTDSVLHDHLATSNALQLDSSRRLSASTTGWTQKWVFNFLLFDILIRARGLRRYKGFSKYGNQLQQARELLLRFQPSTFLAWLIDTTIIIDMTWGKIVNGPKINPRFYVQVPDSHRLMKAARTGNVGLAQYLIETRFTSPFCMTSAGWTPLHWAAAKGKLDMCDFLVSHGADLDAIGYIGMTPLHATAHFGQIEVMKWLITRGSDLNIFHDHGFHAIFQIFVSANALKDAEKLELLDWVIRKQEQFEFDFHALDGLDRNLTQVIVPSTIDTSMSGGTQQSRLVSALLTRNPHLNNQDFEGSTTLHEAAKHGHLDIVEQLLKAFALPNIKDNQGRNPIHYAASSGDEAIVRRLLQENIAGIDECDVTGRTPLRFAVEGNHIDTVKALVDLGAHCDSVDLRQAMLVNAEVLFDFLLTTKVKPNAEVLETAAIQQNLHYLREFIERGANPNSQQEGWPLLSYAVFQKRAPAVQLLLSMGADVNLCGSDGSSALLKAVEEGRLDLVDILLKAGAVTHDLTLHEGKTVNLINTATRNGFLDIAEMLSRVGAPKSAAGQLCAISSIDMRTAAQQNRVYTLEELIRQGGDVNAVNRYGATPFSYACNSRSFEAAILLIDAGTDLHPQKIGTRPPLFDAAENSLPKIVQLLLEKGADVNRLSFGGQTALIHMLEFNRDFHICTCGNRTEYNNAILAAKKLIQAGINVDIVDKDGSTALGMACHFELTDIVKMLLEANADLSIPSAERDINCYFCRRVTLNGIRSLPLELAARAGHEDIVQLLLGKGADWRFLKQQRAIATSHVVLVKHWFADDDLDEETAFLGCEPPEIQLKVTSAAQGRESSKADDNRQKKSKSKQSQTLKAKLCQHFTDSVVFISNTLHWIESYVLYLCVGLGTMILVPLLMFYHKVPFALLEGSWPFLRVLLWTYVFTFVWKTILAWMGGADSERGRKR